MEGITAYGNLAQAEAFPAGSMSIAKDGTGTLKLNDQTGKFTWTQAGDNAITIAIEGANDGFFGGMANATLIERL